jgi:hypothetical protein
MRKSAQLAVSQILRLMIRLMDMIGTVFWYERRLSDAATKQKECAESRQNAISRIRKSNTGSCSQAGL